MGFLEEATLCAAVAMYHQRVTLLERRMYVSENSNNRMVCRSRDADGVDDGGGRPKPTTTRRDAGARYDERPDVIAVRTGGRRSLKVTPEQKTKLQALADKARSEAGQRTGSFRDLSQEERDKIMAEMQKRAESLRKEVATILNSDQVKRLRQIELQQLRSAALLQPEVAETIGLTDQQKKQLEEIATKNAEKVRSMFQERGGGP